MSSVRVSSLRTKTFIFLICAITLSGVFLYGFEKKHTFFYDGALFTPEFVVIRLGDPVTIKNNSQKPMEIAAGRHENHEAPAT